MIKEYLLRNLIEVKIALILDMVRGILGNAYPTDLAETKKSTE